MSQIIAPCRENSRSLASSPQEVVVAVLWLILALWGWLWFGPMWIAAMRPGLSQINDFYQDWGSARNYLVGLPVYTAHTTSIPKHLGLPANPAKSIEYNAHPPTSVLLVLPLAQLNYTTAVLAWNALSLVAFLVSLVIVAIELKLPWTMLPPAVALLPLCHPVYGNLYQCQLTLLLVLLVTAIWGLERSGWSNTAGLLLGAMAAIKLFPAYLAVYYLARRQIRPLLTAALSFLALTLLTAFILGVDTYYTYVDVVLPEQAKFRSFTYNLSIAGFWNKLFNPVAETGLVLSIGHQPALAYWGTLFSDLAVTAIVAKFVYQARARMQQDLAIALAIIAMLLVSPVTWDISLPFLLVPIALFARSSLISRARWASTILAVVLAIDWIPENMLKELTQVGRCPNAFPWTFMLGIASLKFYALLGTFALGLSALQAEKCIKSA